MKRKDSYIAKKPCGCIVMATIDTPGHRKETARVVGQCINQGYRIEHVTAQYVRTHWECKRCARKRTVEEVQQRLLNLCPLPKPY